MVNEAKPAEIDFMRVKKCFIFTEILIYVEFFVFTGLKDIFINPQEMDSIHTHLEAS